MKSILKWPALLLAASVLTATAATDDTGAAAAKAKAAPSIEDLLPDTTVAKGKGFEIKQSQLDKAVINAKANAAARGQEISAEQLPLLEKEALDDMVLLKLLNGAASADQKAQGRHEAETNFTTVKEKTPAEVVARQLKAAGMTEEQYQANLAERATAKVVLLSQVKVTDYDIKKFYDDNPTLMEEAEQAKVSFLTMGGPDSVTGAPLAEDQKAAKKKQIEALRDRARNGEDFAKLVKENSEDVNSKDNGGKITLVRGMRGVPPEFLDAAFALGTNQVSDVIITQFGFHLIKLNERTPARKATLDEATPEIRAHLQEVAIQKMLPTYFAQLRKDANVEILDPKLKALDNPMPAAGQSDSIDSVPTKPAGGAK